MNDSLPIPLDSPDWRMAGMGEVRAVAPDVVESRGGPGIYWYTAAAFDDFLLSIEWQATAKEDNSGVFVRLPPVGDWRAGGERGYEVQIDDRGWNPALHRFHDPLHQTGAVYGLAPACQVASHALGAWNLFEIEVRGALVAVSLNRRPVARLDRELGRPRRGHVGLQTHDPRSRVRFRELRVLPL